MIKLLIVTISAALAAAQFNNHEFLRHPGQEFRQDGNGLRFTQQISHAPAQSGPSGLSAQPSNNFQQQQPNQQQIMAAISQLTPQQIASFLRSHPAVAQQFGPQQQQSAPQHQQQQFNTQPQRIPGPPPFQSQPQPQPRPQFAPQPQAPRPAQQQFNPAQQQQSAQLQQQQQPGQAGPNPNPAAVHFANVGANPGGEYQFGFHTGNQPGAKDNSFREEVRLPDGTVKGAYGYIDANGRQRVVRYTAGKEGFQVEGDIHPDEAPAGPSAPQQQAPRPAPQQQQHRPQPVQQFQPQPQSHQSQFAPQNSNEGPGAALASFLRISGNQRNF